MEAYAIISDRRLKSSAQVDPDIWTVFNISRPARIACVLYGEMSRAAMGIPVLWEMLLEGKGLDSY